MDINATLLVQMLTFALFVWFNMVFVWPPLCRAMDDRAQRISDGLAAAERGQREYQLSKQRVAEALCEAKTQASQIVDKANLRAQQLIDAAKQDAQKEAERIVAQGHAQVTQQVASAKRELMAEVSELAIQAAERIVEQHLDRKASQAVVERFIEEL